MLVFKEPLFSLVMAPKCKGNDASNSDMPRRNCKGEYSIERERARERPHSYSKLYCYNYSVILLSVKVSPFSWDAGGGVLTIS